MPSVKQGDKIRLTAMPDDPDPIPVGSEGIVVDVTDGPLAQITVNWIDMDRTLALIPGVDRFIVIGHEE